MTTTTIPERAQAVLTFWFGRDYGVESDPGYWLAPEQTKQWFRGGPDLDKTITEQFTADVEHMAQGDYDDWLTSPLSAVAGIVLADQFTRNIYRNSAQAFSLDPKALSWSKQLQASGQYKVLPSYMRYFSYMPLMHSEQLEDQQLMVDLISAELERAKAVAPESDAVRNFADILTYAEAHRDVIQKWGRFPHRNSLLGRPNTPEEEAGLSNNTIPRW